MSLWSQPSPLEFAVPNPEDPRVLADLWQSTRARVVMVASPREVAAVGEGWFAKPSGALPPEAVFLGSGEYHWFALAAPPASRPIQARGLGTTPEERAAVIRAVALRNWLAGRQICERCGGKTELTLGSQSRICASCDAMAFPRTDPAVIVAVTDPQDRLFLAHQAQWPTGRVSVLAGFVEAGESVEQACFREVAEEAAIDLTSLSYFGSQPWPFPRSLMLGFTARSVDGSYQVDGQELDWGAYFSRDEVREAVGSGRLGLPDEASIAHRLVTAWLNGS